MIQNIKKGLIWVIITLMVSVALVTIALNRGKTINVVWLVMATISMYVIVYRFYICFIVDKALEFNTRRLIPSVRRDDGLDYITTNRWVFFRLSHFATITRAGPLAGGMSYRLR
ncbi:MAG: carbon starvation CstA family protein [Flavobacteriales bacterium]